MLYNITGKIGVACIALFCVLILACGGKKENKEPVFPNLAVVTPDSCGNWKVPATAFAIEYPNSYEVIYFDNEQYYLTLRKTIEGKIERNISIGMSKQLKTKSDFKNKFDKLDSTYQTYPQVTYEKTFIGESSIQGEEFLQFSAYLSIGEVPMEGSRGTYTVTTLAQLPEKEELNGVFIAFTRRLKSPQETQDLSPEEIAILETFRFIEP